jgi:hypothetical protein
MSYPPHLMDALARVYAKVALDRLIKDEMARAEPQNDAKPAAVSPAADPEKEGNVDGPGRVESSDNREQLLPEPRPRCLRPVCLYPQNPLEAINIADDGLAHEAHCVE